MSDRARRLLDETAAARNDVLALATGLSAEQLNRPTVHEGWSVKDTLAHLASTEARQRLILRTVLDGGTWSAGREERDAYNARCVAERRAWTPDAVIAELRDTGQETASLFGRLTPEELDRELDHPIFGRMTIERTARITARHLRSHATELRAALEVPAAVPDPSPSPLVQTDWLAAHLDVPDLRLVGEPSRFRGPFSPLGRTVRVREWRRSTPTSPVGAIAVERPRYGHPVYP